MKNFILNVNEFQNSKDLSEFHKDLNLKKRIFSSGVKRYVHVNRYAIEHNCQNGTNYPIIIVIDENFRKHEFHAVHFSGILSYAEINGIEAKVFMVTFEEIIGYSDPSAPSTFAFAMRHKKKNNMWQKISRRTKNLLAFFDVFYGLKKPFDV